MRDSDAEVAAVAALDEPTRRALYDHVARQPEPVSRDDAAAAVDVPRSTAAFHLDRLADEGLLDVVYERRSGRTGPGAGRPSKLYRRSRREVAVSLPGRRYEVVGELLAAALDEAEALGESPQAVLERKARELGRQMGAVARESDPRSDTGGLIVEALEAHGFEPRTEADTVVLANCPFHALAERHAALVCGMNLRLLDGLLDSLTPTGMQARLDPQPGRCCVRIEPADESGGRPAEPR
ncbi:MAG: helix-turn-helix transcriptional regulator [Nocardioidaceae bacterium]